MTLSVGSGCVAAFSFQYLSEPEKIWKEMNLFSIAYTDDCFDDWVTIRIYGAIYFFPSISCHCKYSAEDNCLRKHVMSVWMCSKRQDGRKLSVMQSVN